MAYKSPTRISNYVQTSSASGWADFPYAYSGSISIPSTATFAYIEQIYAIGTVPGYNQYNRTNNRMEFLVYSVTNQQVLINIVYW